jgi:hypothetical protein
VVQRDGTETNSIISNMRNNISYKIHARLYAWKKGTADAEALVLLPADGVC